jgi:hypothetical protein
MRNAAQYRQYADDCRKLAQQTPAHSEALLKIAEAWETLAQEAEKNKKATPSE